MKKSFVVLAFLSLMFSSLAQASSGVALLCALKPNQTRNNVNGFAVVYELHGRKVTYFLRTYQHGRMTKQEELDDAVKHLGPKQVQNDRTARSVLKRSGIDPRLAFSGSTIEIAPGTEMANYFDRDAAFLAGAILSPGEQTRLCYSVRNLEGRE